MSEKEKPKFSTTPPDAPDERHADDLRDANEQLMLTALQAQEAAETSAQRYHDLVEGVDAIVWEAEAEADSDTLRFTFVSQQAQMILGYPVERWLKEPNWWIDLIHPEDREQAVSTCKATAAARKDFRIEYRAMASDGRVVWLAMITRMRDGDGGPTQLRGLMLDITEHKRTEAKLQQLVRELETSRTDLQERNEELEKFHDITVGRELKMIQLEKEVERLQKELDALTTGRAKRGQVNSIETPTGHTNKR